MFRSTAGITAQNICPEVTMTERTLAIIKPDAVKRGLVGTILKMIEESGLTVRGMKMIHMTRAQAEGFYAVHKERPFFAGLTEFMSSGPAVVAVLEGENAIAVYRELMGNTAPAKAAPDTIRKLYGLDVEKNSCHGSDAPLTAATEIAYFFNNLEISS